MDRRINESTFAGLRTHPAKFMMYCALRRALRTTDQFRKNDRGIIVGIVDEAWIWHCKSAALLLLPENRDAYSYDDFRRAVHVLGLKSKKARVNEVDDVAIIHPDHQVIYLAPSLDLVPRSLRLAADVIVDIKPPTARHVLAARRIGGVDDLDPSLAEQIVLQPADIVVGLAARRSLTSLDQSLLQEPAGARSRSPTLSELPGYGAARAWVASLKQDVDDWRKDVISWAEVDKGILLAGPPGTGKTLFATALANELGFDLIATSVGDWQGSRSGHLGTTLSAMSKSFADAASRHGAVLFIDELDAIGDRARMRDDHIYYEGNVIGRLLELITHLFEQPGAILVGATNYPLLIDPAILRSGRLEEHVYLDLPDEVERAEILSYHLENSLSALELRPLTDKLRLVTPADLDRLARRAKRAARSRGGAINLKDVEAVLPAKVPLPEDVVHRICVHECGHALVAMASGYADVISIRVESRMVAGETVQDGGRMHYQMRDPALPTEKQLLAKMRIMLAGIAAEEVVFGEKSIGAGGVQGSDLDQATRLAYRLAGSYGLGKSLRFQVDASRVDQSFAPTPELRAEVDGILTREYRATKDLLAREKGRLMRMAAELVVDREIRIERS